MLVLIRDGAGVARPVQAYATTAKNERNAAPHGAGFALNRLQTPALFLRPCAVPVVVKCALAGFLFIVVLRCAGSGCASLFSVRSCRIYCIQVQKKR